MAASSRDARRRRRIIEGGEDRIALITGRKQHLSADVTNDPLSSLPSPSTDTLLSHHLSLHEPGLRHDLIFDSPPQPQPHPHPISAFQNEEKKASATAYTTQGDLLTGQISEEPLMRNTEAVAQLSKAPASEQNRVESSTQAPKALTMVAELVQRIPISQLSAQQVGIAVTATENQRMLCAIVMSVFVVLSSAGFPILSSFLFRWIILFRPLILLIFANLGMIAQRLIPVNQRNLARGAKDENKPVLGDGYAWAEEAGRALEVVFILQSVMSSLFMDCSVYAAIVVFGLSLLG